MKKLLIIVLMFSAFVTTAQTLPNDVMLEVNRIGVNTEAKDTLFLLDCQVGLGLKDSWACVTKQNLIDDGIEKAPVFVMVDSLSEFKSLICRFDGVVDPNSLTDNALKLEK